MIKMLFSGAKIIKPEGILKFIFLPEDQFKTDLILFH